MEAPGQLTLEEAFQTKMAKPRPSLDNLYPDQLVARCTRAQAEQLVNYDHHRVRVNGRLAVMLTFHWLPLEAAPEPLLLKVIFAHAEQHPPVPGEVQALVDALSFLGLPT